MKTRWIVGIMSALAMAGSSAIAQESTNRVGANTDWSIFVEDNPKQCWVVSAPKKTVNTRDGRVVAVRRGDIYMFVSFWPGEKKRGEVSFMGGYPFKPDSTVSLEVAGTKFELFTKDETAWPASEDEDRKITTALKRGAEAVITGRSARGTITKDTFSLMGFTAAYEDAAKRCGA